MSITLTDQFGRTIEYLRLSVTDRCNLRCLYCMPSEGIGRITHDEVMRFEELTRICRILGIGTVRVTGGEPLVRKGVANFIGELKSVARIRRVAMTTNGVLLGEHLETLVAYGLDAVNISLDTLDEEKFRRLTNGGGMGNILPAIDMALAFGLDVKINCVPMRGFNEEDIVRIAALARDRNMAVRFIELMPLGTAAKIQPLPIKEVVALIEKSFGSLSAVSLATSPVKAGSGPAVYYTLPGFAGRIGLISALSQGFCKKCNRLRLTAAGVLKPCLSSDLGIDLRRLIRSNASDGEIETAVRELVAKKPAGHSFGGVISNAAASAKQDHRNKEMFRIGG